MMSYFLNLLSSFVEHHILLAYGVLFLAIFWEGEIALIIAGVFAHLGILSFPLTIAVAIAAAVAKTILGYRLGQYLGRRFPRSPFLRFLTRRILHFLPQFRKRPFWSIVASKFIYGVNNATLVFAGYVRADFRKYCLAELLSSAVWFGGMFGLGYFFSTKALAFSHNVRNFSLIILLGIIGVMVFLKIVNLLIELIEEWGAPEIEQQ